MSTPSSTLGEWHFWLCLVETQVNRYKVVKLTGLSFSLTPNSKKNTASKSVAPGGGCGCVLRPPIVRSITLMESGAVCQNIWIVIICFMKSLAYSFPLLKNRGLNLTEPGARVLHPSWQRFQPFVAPIFMELLLPKRSNCSLLYRQTVFLNYKLESESSLHWEQGCWPCTTASLIYSLL